MKINRFSIHGFMMTLALTSIACTPSPEEVQQSNRDQAKQALLDQGLEFNLDGYMQYVARDDLEVTKLFLQAGMDVDGQAEPGATTALAMISSSHKPEMIRFLLENGADPNGNGMRNALPIIRAALANELEVAGMLLDAGADANTTSDDSDIVGKGTRSVLMIAVDRGHLEMAKLLVDRGADIGTRNERDETALSLAEEGGHSEIADFLQASDPAMEPEAAQSTTESLAADAPPPDNTLGGAVPVYPGMVFSASEQPRAFESGEFAGVPANQLSTVEGEASADVKAVYDFYMNEIPNNRAKSWLIYEAEYGLWDDSYSGWIRGNDYRKYAFEVELSETETGTYVYFTMGPHR